MVLPILGATGKERVTKDPVSGIDLVQQVLPPNSTFDTTCQLRPIAVMDEEANKNPIAGTVHREGCPSGGFDYYGKGEGEIMMQLDGDVYGIKHADINTWRIFIGSSNQYVCSGKQKDSSGNLLLGPEWVNATDDNDARLMCYVPPGVGAEHPVTFWTGLCPTRGCAWPRASPCATAVASIAA